jgi:hypothetical protein
LEAEPFQQPAAAVALAESLERLGQLLQRGEVSHPEQLFLEGAEEALDAAVAFRFSDKGGRRFDVEKRHLAPKVVPHVNNCEPSSCPSLTAQARFSATLPNFSCTARRTGSSASNRAPRLGTGMPETSAVARSTHGENRHPAIGHGEANRGVDAPHRVGPLGQDRALVALRLNRLRLPLRRQQAVVPH